MAVKFRDYYGVLRLCRYERRALDGPLRPSRRVTRKPCARSGSRRPGDGGHRELTCYKRVLTRR